MAQGKNTTNLTELLLQCMSEPDPIHLFACSNYGERFTNCCYEDGISSVDLRTFA